jgi:5'-deoxynucleotidase YfbR-like HD superfamily hydrolase
LGRQGKNKQNQKDDFNEFQEQPKEEIQEEVQDVIPEIEEKKKLEEAKKKAADGLVAMYKSMKNGSYKRMLVPKKEIKEFLKRGLVEKVPSGKQVS